MSVTVFLANQGFTLPVTNVDDRRREAYFKNPTDPNYQLVPEEDKILLALGIDKQALGTLKENESSCLNGRMAEFFKQLPKCQSDSSLMLAKDCEVVHCVLWETLLAAQSRSKDMYKDNWNKKKPWGDISVAINNQILNDLKPKRENLDDVDRLFTLIMKAGVPVASPISALPSAPVPSAPVPSAPATPADVNKLFTLILPGQTEENPQPAVPSPPESTAEPENAASAITAPSVSSNSSTSTKSSWFTRKTGKTPFTKETTPATQPNRPSWFTRKFGKKPLGSTPGPQINLGASPNNEGPVNHPGESPFTRPSGQVPLADEETEEFQQENPMVPSANRVGESPFTQRSTEVPLGGPERGPPLGVIPTDEEINNQCEGRPRPTEREKHEEEFKRSLYFFHSIKHQEDIDLANADLNPEAEKKFLADWNKAIKGSRDKLAASLKFLDVPADKLVEMNRLYRNFIKGGERPNPILAYGCNKIGETASGFLERFYQSVERTPSERTYLFQHADWSSGEGSHINLETPTSVNAVDISVRDTKVDQQYKNADIHNLTILTTRDINYVENDAFGFNYNIQGRHITDYLLIRDLFAKNKNYVLDISPQLIYLFYKERNSARPTPDGGSITINEAFFKNAFGGNHIPPQLSSDLKVQGQVDIAYYGICNTLTVTDKKPYRFYSKPTSSKLNDIIEWLENATDQQYAPIRNLMRWAVPTETPIQQAVLLDLFKSVAKKPQTFLNRMFTRKNKKNRNNATTRRNQAPPAPQEPRNALTAARAAAIGAPPQLLLEAPGVPKQKKEMDDATLRNILARAEPRPGSVAAQAAERASPPPLPIPESLPLYNSETNGTFSNTESNGESTAEATELAEEAVNNDQSIVLDMPKPSMAQKLGAFFKGKNPKPESPPSTNSNYYEPKEPTTVETWAAAQRAAMSPQEPLEKRTTLQKLKNRFFKTKKNKKPNNNGRNLTRRVVRPKIPVMPEGLSPLVTPVANLSGFSSNNPPPPSNPQREEYIRMARNIGLVEDDAIEAEKEAEARVKNNKEKYNKFLKKTPAKQSELLKKLVRRILQRKQTELLAELNHPQEQEYTNEEKAMLASLNEEIRREQSPE